MERTNWFKFLALHAHFAQVDPGIVDDVVHVAVFHEYDGAPLPDLPFAQRVSTCSDHISKLTDSETLRRVYRTNVKVFTTDPQQRAVIREIYEHCGFVLEQDYVQVTFRDKTVKRVYDRMIFTSPGK